MSSFDVPDAIARVRAKQPASFAPDLSPSAVLAELDADYPARDGRTRARRRLLLSSLETFQRARESREDWYVWISEIYASRNSSGTDVGTSSPSLSSGVMPTEIL